MSPLERFIERKAWGALCAIAVAAVVGTGHFIATGNLPDPGLIGLVLGALAFAGVVNHRRGHRRRHG